MNSNKLDLAMTILKFALGFIGIAICIPLFFGANQTSTMAEQEAFREGVGMGLASFFTGLATILGVALVVAFFVVQLITNTKRTVLSIIGILVMLGLYFILTLAGTSDTNESLALGEKNLASDSTLASTSAGIYTVFVGLAVGLLVVVLGPLMGKYRK